VFLVSRPAHPLDLPSFPTRRSSDLILECIQQEPELGAGLFLINTQDTEHFLLHLLIVDTDGTAAQLSAVKNHIVGARQRRSRVRSEEHTSELQSRENLVCRLLLEKK